MNIAGSSIQLDLITILLTVPIVATWIAFARHIIGLKSFGVFTSMMLTFIFFELGLNGQQQSEPLNGLKYGLILVVLIFLTTTLAYGIIKGWSLHYQPKIAIIVTLVTLVLSSIIIISIRFNLMDLIRLDLISLVAILVLAEKFIGILSRKNFRVALFVFAETTIVAVIGYLIISWNELTQLLLDYPLIILLLLPVNYLLGKYTGLRVREFYRFRNILDNPA